MWGMLGCVYERFTSDARKALVAGQVVARSVGADATGLGHLLVALAGAQAWVSDLLVGLGLTTEHLRPLLVHGLASPDVMPLTPDARHALEAAALEAERLQRDAIGAEHLLLGILDVGGEAKHMLLVLGHDPDDIRRALLSVGPGIEAGVAASPILRLAPPVAVSEVPDLLSLEDPDAPGGPRCPGCFGDLSDAVRHLRMPVDIEVTVDLVYCGRCGHTLTTRVVERG